MEEKHIELFGRMMAHEFLLEIMIANEFARSDNPKTNWQLFSGEILKSFGMSEGESKTDPASEVSREAEKIINNILLRTEARLNSILEIKEGADTTPAYESDL
jgi:hypothetical protein